MWSRNAPPEIFRMKCADFAELAEDPELLFQRSLLPLTLLR